MRSKLHFAARDPAGSGTVAYPGLEHSVVFPERQGRCAECTLVQLLLTGTKRHLALDLRMVRTVLAG